MFLLINMAAHLSSLLILTALTVVAGISSKTTVSKVSVKRGGSISVPCLYAPKYTNHVKYLCQGKDWSSCSYVVKTNKPSEPGRFLISDDKQKRIFTVTINNLTVVQQYFWCAVETKGWPDDGMSFQLLVTPDHPQLSVDHQEVTGFVGGDITVHCHHNVGGESRWCRLGGSCVKEPSGSIEGTKVTINVKDPQLFSVTLSELMTHCSGWYFCAKGDLQMPVHLTVARPRTTISVNGERTTVQAQPNSSASNHLLAVIIPLSLAIFLTMTALISWFILRKRTNEEPPAGKDDTYEVMHRAVTHATQAFNTVQAGEDVVYSTLNVKRKKNRAD